MGMQKWKIRRYCQKFYEKQGMRYGNRGKLDDREEREVIVQ